MSSNGLKTICFVAKCAVLCRRQRSGTLSGRQISVFRWRVVPQGPAVSLRGYV